MNIMDTTMLTLFLPAKGGISPYMSITWQSPVGIGLREIWFIETFSAHLTGMTATYHINIWAQNIKKMDK